MPEPVGQGLVLLIQLLEIFGAGFLIVGFVVATTQWFRRMHQLGPQAARERYRQSLGRCVLVGLEVLVAATIIKTITVEGSLEGMGLLAAMIVVRTVLGWTTVLEVSGRWPWQSARSPTSSAGQGRSD